MKNYFLVLSLLVLTYANAQDLTFQWAKGIGGNSNFSDYASGITIDINGNVFTTGRFAGTVDFDPGESTFNLTAVGFVDIFVLKLDSDGNFLWAKQMGGSGFDEGISITTDTFGNAYITGFFSETADFDPGTSIENLTSNGETDIFIQKLDSDGELIWVKQIGGTSFDFGQSIIVNDNNIYITGSFAGDTDFDPNTNIFNLISFGSNDIFIQKLDSDGNLLWVKQVIGNGYDTGRELIVDGDGDVLITGYFSNIADFDPSIDIFNLTPIGLKDIFVLKLNSNGNFIWVKQMGGSEDDEGFSIKTDTDNNIYTTGYFRGTSDFDPSSNVFNFVSFGGNDIFIQKLNSNGDFIWANQMGGSEDEQAFSIDIDLNNNAFITGGFRGTVDFDPTTNTNNLVSSGEIDIFIQKFDSNGNSLWVKDLGASSFDSGLSIAVQNNEVLTAGSFYNTVDFNPDDVTVNELNSVENTGDIFIQKLVASSLSTNDYKKDFYISAFPNPTSNTVNIKFRKTLADVNVDIFNLQGKLIKSSSYKNSDNIVLNLDASRGIYFIHLTTSEGNKVFSIIRD